MQINTANGPKSPGEALEIFKHAQLPAGSLLGIYSQLIQTERGAEATTFVTKNPAKFNDKIQRMAKEQSTGRPIGPKTITSKQHALEIITDSGLRPTLKITLRKDRPSWVLALLGAAPRLITFHDKNAQMLLGAVALSERWERVNRTYFVTVNACNERDLDQVASIFNDTVESIELTSNMTDRVTVRQDGITDILLTKNPELFYDKSLFYQACAKINHPHAADLWVLAITSPNITMLEMLKVMPLQHRLNFLEAYIQCFNDSMALA